MLFWFREQQKLREKLLTTDVESWQECNAEQFQLDYIGGVDISFVKDDSVHACAALVILSYPELQVSIEDYIKNNLNGIGKELKLQAHFEISPWFPQAIIHPSNYNLHSLTSTVWRSCLTTDNTEN